MVPIIHKIAEQVIVFMKFKIHEQHINKYIQVKHLIP